MIGELSEQDLIERREAERLEALANSGSLLGSFKNALGLKTKAEKATIAAERALEVEGTRQRRYSQLMMLKDELNRKLATVASLEEILPQDIAVSQRTIRDYFFHGDTLSLSKSEYAAGQVIHFRARLEEIPRVRKELEDELSAVVSEIEGLQKAA